MRDLVVLFLHLLATVARLAGPGGARAVVAESVLVKHQLLILNRSRRRAPNLRLADRIVAGVCALLMRPSRLIRSAIVLKPSTLLRLHRALRQRKYRQLFSSMVPKKPGPKGPSQELIAAVVAMKQRNPTWGCPRIAQQIVLAFGIPLKKDVVRRILAARYKSTPDASGPSWLTMLGHAKDRSVERRSVSMRIGDLAGELDHLKAAVIAAGADVQTLVSAMRTREAERRRLVEQLTPPVPPPVIDSTAVLRELDGRLCHWRSLLREHPSSARRGLKQLIIGRLDMAPDEETGGYRFRGRGTLQPLITGLIPGGGAAPPSDGSGWGRHRCWVHFESLPGPGQS